ncbi:MAG TPA: HD-GYP domain-containing protein [Anaerolineales bacterium]|nr:HD-GYP domain-containing protein [Anaerolineales bacterium]
MAQTPSMVLRERIFAGLLTVAGTYAFTQSLVDMELSSISSQKYLLAFLFASAIILANQYPIHLLRGTKLSLINLPIFLSAVLLPAPLAILATGAGLFVANILTRAERGILPRDIASTVGQWMFTVFLGYQIVHLALPGFHGHTSGFGLLLLCTFSFLLIDFIVFSLSQSFIYHEPFISTLKSVAKEGILLEAIQYLIAILGVFAAYENIWSLVLLIVPISITYIAFKNIKETHRDTIRLLEDMADTVDLRDIYTGGHSKRVTDLVHQTLLQMNVTGYEARLIETSARLHDIGKIGIPDAILMKSGMLSPQEMAVMQTHSQKGAELISKYKDFARGALIIMHHHERWDGAGYPAGLKGYEIPFGARVIAVADSFDAMTSDRPYRKALSVRQAIQILLEGRGKQWEPTVVNAFVDIIIHQVDEESIKHSSQQQAASALSQTVLVTS